MERIIVGVDGSDASADALRWATAVAAATGAKIVAVNAFHNPHSEVSVDQHEALMSERADVLNREWTAAPHEAGVAVRGVVRDGDPRDVVHAAATEEQADLIVIGRTGPGGGPGFLHLGSVAEHAAHHATVPVAVIPAGTRRGPTRVLLAVDGSDPSLRAVTWLRDLAAQMSLPVVAVEVEEPYLEWTPSTSPENWRRSAEREIGEWTDPLSRNGVSVTSVVEREAHPADGILHAARANDCDLVVMGARGVGGVTGLRIGGVAIKVLHGTPLPLVLVPGH